MLLEDLKLVLRRVELNIEGPNDFGHIKNAYVVKGPSDQELFTLCSNEMGGNIRVAFYDGNEFWKGWYHGIDTGVSAMKREIVKNFGGG